MGYIRQISIGEIHSQWRLPFVKTFIKTFRYVCNRDGTAQSRACMIQQFEYMYILFGHTFLKTRIFAKQTKKR